MPARNAEAYFAEAIDSILRQSYKDWELIIVNDASTDATQTLINYYMDKDPRIDSVTIKKSEGIAHARNIGIETSVGEYIAVMDADDMMMPNRLKLSLKAIKDVDFTYGAYYLTDEHGIVPNGVHQAPKKVTFEMLKENNAWPHVTIMARRKLFLKTPYREEAKVNDDAFLCLDWFLRRYTSRPVTKEPLMIVRYHGESTSKTKQKAILKTQEILNKEYNETVFQTP